MRGLPDVSISVRRFVIWRERITAFANVAGAVIGIGAILLMAGALIAAGK